MMNIKNKFVLLFFLMSLTGLFQDQAQAVDYFGSFFKKIENYSTKVIEIVKKNPKTMTASAIAIAGCIAIVRYRKMIVESCSQLYKECFGYRYRSEVDSFAEMVAQGKNNIKLEEFKLWQEKQQAFFSKLTPYLENQYQQQGASILRPYKEKLDYIKKQMHVRVFSKLILCLKERFYLNLVSKVDPRTVPGVDLNAPLSEEKIREFFEYKRAKLAYDHAPIRMANDLHFHLLARFLVNESNTYEKIEKIIEEALRLAFIDKQKIVTMQHVNNAWINIEFKPVALPVSDSHKYSNAIHEAGHAIAYLFKCQKHYQLYFVTILPSVKIICNQTVLAGGYARSNALSKCLMKNFTYKNIKNDIIMLFSGIVAEQVFNLGVNKSLANLLSSEGGSSDVAQAQAKVNLVTNGDQVRNNQIFQECYDEAWNFISACKEEVKIVADLLIEKGIVSAEEIRDSLKMDTMLYDFEEGPLPKKLTEAGCYKLRVGLPSQASRWSSSASAL